MKTRGVLSVITSVTLILYSHSVCAASSCRTRFEYEQVCYGTYGDELAHVSGLPSGSACAMSCAKVAECRSFVFDPDADRLCRLNAEEATAGFGDGCTAKVTYGRLEKATCRDAWHYEPCTTHTDCQVANSYCLDNTVCTCNYGYSYEHRTDSCVASCSSGYGSQFSSYPGGLMMYNNDVIYVNTVEECTAACVAAATFTCRSVEYIEATPTFRCQMSTETLATKPNDHVAHTTANPWVTQVRNCA